jgi:chromosome segregation ATPase
MTFVGKVLVVVQVVLSLCFMAFAGAVYTVQQEWKTAHDKKVAELDASKKEVVMRDEQIALLNKDLAATNAIQENVQTYLDNQDQFLASQTGNDQIKNQLRILAERLQRAEAQLSTAQAEVDKVNSMNMVLRKTTKSWRPPIRRSWTKPRNAPRKPRLPSRTIKI